MTEAVYVNKLVFEQNWRDAVKNAALHGNSVNMATLARKQKKKKKKKRRPTKRFSVVRHV